MFMGAWLGPRWNEAIGVRRCDLNPLRQEITVGKAVVNQNGSQTYVEWLSKTEDFRTIPVPQPVMERLLQHVAKYCRDAGREDFLFLTRNGTHPCARTWCSAQLCSGPGCSATSPGSRCGTRPRP